MKIECLLSFLIFHSFLFSCNNTGEPATENNDQPIESNGVHIDYTDSKTGDTCLLFIHGWNIDKTYWENQQSFFRKNYRVVTIDLPGFGKSGKNRQDWTVKNYGNDITHVINSLGLNNILVIGHSMSGAIALETALQNPGKVMGIVGVDNFTNFGDELTPEIKKEIAAYEALRSNYQEVVQQYVNSYLIAPSTDSIVTKRVMFDFLHADSLLSVTILQTNEDYALDEKLKTYGKTLYLINSSFHATDTTNFQKYQVPYKLLLVGPTGHYPMIENPDEFNLRLQQVIQQIGTQQENKLN